MENEDYREGIYWAIQYANWQERVLSDRTASGEDGFIIACMTNSDFLE